MAKAAGFELGKKALLKGAIHAGEHTLAHGIQHLPGRAAAIGMKALHGASLAYWIYSGVQLTTKGHMGAVNDAKQQAQREMDGLNRDAMRVFILGVCGDVFAADFKQAVLRDVPPEAKSVAGKMVTHATQRGGYEGERVVAQVKAQQGMQMAKELEIRTGADLQKALATNPKFRDEYETSTAFRFGVAAHVFGESKPAKR